MISVVIRCKDEAASIGRVLDLLAGQTVTPQVIVVDSGSTDGTVEIVRGHGSVDRLVEIPAASFTYGGALNTGTEHADHEVVVALSAHSFPEDDAWLARMLEAMGEADVACASAQRKDAEGAPLHGPVRQDAAMARRHPRWGYSSHAGGFRRSLWAQRPFRTDMSASEDKEWAYHWLHQGFVAVLDPALVVDHSHGSDPPLSQYRRARGDWIGLGMYADVPPPSLRALAATWWGDRGGYPSAARALLSHKRAARLLGDYAGQRAASRRS